MDVTEKKIGHPEDGGRTFLQKVGRIGYTLKMS